MRMEVGLLEAVVAFGKRQSSQVQSFLVSARAGVSRRGRGHGYEGGKEGPSATTAPGLGPPHAKWL